MKRFASLIIFLSLISCSHSDSIIGKWVAEKVDFEFDERRGTPEMIQQLGEQEVHNTLIFKNDSIVNVVMFDMNGDYRYKIEGNDILIENLKIGTLESGKIVSKMETPIGEMTVIYGKK